MWQKVKAIFRLGVTGICKRSRWLNVQFVVQNFQYVALYWASGVLSCWWVSIPVWTVYCLDNVQIENVIQIMLFTYNACTRYEISFYYQHELIKIILKRYTQSFKTIFAVVKIYIKMCLQGSHDHIFCFIILLQKFNQ